MSNIHPLLPCHLQDSQQVLLYSSNPNGGCDVSLCNYIPAKETAIYFNLENVYVRTFGHQCTMSRDTSHTAVSLSEVSAACSEQ